METEASDMSYEYCPYNDLGGNRYDGQSQFRETGGGDSVAFDDSKWWWGTPVAANRQQQQQQQLGFDVDDDEVQLWASLADMC